MRFRLSVGLVCLLAACSELPHESPFDVLSPLSKQAKATLTLRVLLQGEADHSQVTVELRNDERVYSIDSDASGAVALPGVVPGEYALAVRTRYFKPFSDAVTVELGANLDLGTLTLPPLTAAVRGSAKLQTVAGETVTEQGGVTLRLVKTGSVRGEPAKAPGGLRAAADEPAYETVSGADGSYTFTGVDAGQYALVATGPEVPPTQVEQLTVTGEETVEIADVLLTPLTGFFRVVDALGRTLTLTNDRDVYLELSGFGAARVRYGLSANGTAAACQFTTDRELVGTAPFQLPASDATHTVCVKYVDEGGNETAPLLRAVTLDATPPELADLAAATTNGYVRANRVVVSITALDGGSGATSYRRAASAPGLAAALPLTLQPSVEVLLAAGDGPKTIWFDVADAAGNRSAPRAVTVTVDTAAPAGTATLRTTGGALAGSTERNARLVIASTASDALGTPLEMQVAVNGAAQAWEPFVASRTVDLPLPSNPAGETRTVTARLRDAAGNVMAADLLNATFTLDTVAPANPQLTILNKVAGTVTSPTVTVQLGASDSPVAVELAADPLFVTSFGTFAPNGTQNVTLGAGDGLRAVYARYVDAAGNTSAVAGDSVIVDTTPPASAAFAVANASPTATNALTLTYSADGAAELRVAEGATCAGAWEAYGPGTKTFTVAGGEGERTVSMQFRDAARNATACLSRSVTLDQVFPVAGAVVLNSGQPATSSSVVTVTFPGTSGASKLMLSELPGFGDATWAPYVASKSFLLSAGDGLKRVYAQVADDAGNVTALGYDEITLDTSAPAAPFVAAAVPVTTQSQVLLTLSAGVVADMMISESATFAGASWETYAPAKLFALTAGDGTKTVYAKFRKATGIETGTVTTQVIVDATPPTFASLRVNNGATVVSNNVVTVSLSAVDGASGLATYKINTANSFGAGGAKTFVSTDVFSLPAVDGSYTLWTIIGDRAGNYSAPASATVLLDRAAPVVASAGLERLDGTPVAGGATINEGRLLLVSSVSDLTPLEIQVTTNGSFAGTAWAPYQSTLVVDVLSTTAVVSARVRDGAGNTADLFTGVAVSLDTQPPTGNSLSINGNAALTNVRDVTLALGSTGAAQMRVSENSDFSGAAWESFTMSRPFTLSTGDGAKVVYAQFRDTAGNASAAVSKLIQLDTAAPVGQSVVVNGGAAYATSANVSLTISGVGADQMQVSESAAFAGAAWVPFTTVYPYAITGGEGARTVYVRLRDQAGNVTAGASDGITLDTVPPASPTIAIVQSPQTRSTVIDLLLGASGASQMIIGDDAAFSGRTWQPYAASAVWAVPAGDALKTVYVKFRDDAGNETAAVFAQTTLDSQGPTLLSPPVQINAGAAYTNDSSVTVTVRYVDAVTAAVGEDSAVAFPVTSVTLPNGGLHAFTYPLSAGEGLKSVYVKFYDAAGNPVVQGAAITVDKTRPALAAVLIDGGAAYNNSVAGAATLTLSGFDAGSGVAQVRISNTNGDGDLDGAAAQAYAPVKAWTLANPGADAEGLRTVYVKLVDGAGNESAAAVVDDINYDTKAPQAGPWSLAIGTAEYSSSQSNTLAIAATGATHMQLSQDSLFTGAAWDSYQTARTWVFPAGGDGVLQTLYVRFRDAAGNTTAFYGDSITIDTQAPSGVAMSLDGGAEYGGTPQPSYTRDPEIAVQALTATNWTLAEVSDDVGFQNLIGSFGPATVFPQSVQLSADNRFDGLKTVYARFRDATGNYSPIVSRSIYLDTTKPSPVSVIANGGAAYVNAVNGILTLALSAVDSGSGLGDMRMAHDNASLAAATAEPFSGSKLWTVADPGAGKEYLAEVHFQVADRAGNWSDPVVDAINYDTLAPVLGGQPIAFPAPQPSRLRATVAQFDVAGATEMLLGNDSLFTARTWEPFAYDRQWTFQGGGDDVAYSLYAVFRDAAGNQTAIQSASFRIDDVAPSSPSITLTGGQEYGATQNANYSRDSEYYVSVTATNFTQVELAYDPAFGSVFDSFSAATGMPLTRYLPGYDGPFVVYARFFDQAGNVSTVAYDTITVDSSPPYVTSILVDGHDVFLNPWLEGPWAVTSETGAFTLRVDATDYGTGASELVVVQNHMGYSEQTVAFQPQPKSLTLDGAGPFQSNTRYLELRVRDAAGNQDVRTIDFQYFTQKPNISPPMVVDENGMTTQWTGSRTINVRFAGGYEIKQYQLADNPYFSGASWLVPPAPVNNYCYPWCSNDFTVPFTLALNPPNWSPGPGIPPPPYNSGFAGEPSRRKVFARVKNEFGIASDLIQVDPTEIYLDTNLPLAPTVSLARRYLQSTNIPYSFTLADMNPLQNDYLKVQVDTDPSFEAMSPVNPLSINPKDEPVFGWGGFPYNGSGSINLSWQQPDGPLTLYFRSVDQARNASSTVAVAVTLDTWRPALTSALVNGGKTFVRSKYLVVDASAIDPANTYTGGTASGLEKLGVIQSQWGTCDAADYSGDVVTYADPVSIAPGWIFGEGAYTVYLCVLDRAGNYNEPFQNVPYSFVYDRTEPQGVLFEPAFAGTATNTVNVRLNATSTDFDPVEVLISNDALFTNAVWQPAGSQIPWILTAGDGGKTVYAKFRDQAGNETAVESITITLDTTPPQAGSLVVNGGAPQTSQTAVSYDLSAVELLSPPLEMQFGADPGFTGASWEPYATSGSTTIPAGDGYRTLYVRFRDSLGNTSGASAASFTLDQTGPQLSFLEVNDAAVMASTAVPIDFLIGNWSAGDKLQVSTDAGFAAYDEFAANAGANRVSYALPGPDGAVTVYIRGQDPLGNFGPVYQAPLTRDTSAPVPGATPVTLGGGAPYTKTRFVTLDLDVSGATQMMLSASGTFAAAQWEPYKAQTVWFLAAGDGQQFVYAKFRDDAGNTVAGFSDDVVLDETVPAAPGLQVADTNGDGYALSNTNVELKWTAVADVNLAGYRLERFVEGEDLTFAALANLGTGVTQLSDDVTATTGLTHQYRVFAYDLAGNESAPSVLAVAKPFEPVDGVWYLREYDGYKYSFWPPRGTFSMQTSVNQEDTSRNLTTISLPFNQAFWKRAEPSTALNEELFLRTGNQTNTLVYESAVPLRLDERLFVDTPLNVGWGSSVTVDAQGAVHVSYADKSNGDLKYATNKSGAWVAATIDAAPVMVERTSVALDAAGRAHVAYTTNFPASLKYAYDTGAGWSVAALEASVGEGVGLGLDAAGKAHIAFIGSAQLRYITNASGAWAASELVDANGRSTPAIAVDKNGFPHISYGTPFIGDDLKYAEKTSGAWNVVTVDSLFNVGEFSSIKVDNDGYAHISYIDATQSDVKYATNKWGGWSAGQASDSLATASGYTAIGLDSDGNVYIVYYDQSEGALRLAGPGGTHRVLDTFGNTGKDPALAVDRQGNLAVSYFEQTAVDADLKVALVKNPAPAHKRLDQLGRVGEYPSLAFDPAGKAHISYYDYTNGNLKYATNASGDWAYQTADAAGDDVGLETALALDAGNKAHVAYHDKTNRDLKYATNASGAWVSQVVDGTGDTGYGASIVLSAAGLPRISYVSESVPWGLRYAEYDGAAWAITVVDDLGYLRDSALALDSQGKAHIAYYDEGARDLKYATNASGSWQKTTLDATGNVGSCVSIAVDAQDAVHVSYCDDTNSDLKYATNASGAWVTRTLDSTAKVTFSTSIGVDAAGRVHIAYYDWANADLKYATNASGTWVYGYLDVSGPAVSASTGSQLSLDVGPDGRAGVAYLEYLTFTDANLKFATGFEGKLPARSIVRAASW